MKKIQFIAIVALLAAMASTAGATVYSWIDGAPATWSTTTRWSPNGQPAGAANYANISGTNVVIISGATQMSPAAGGANVTVSNTAAIVRDTAAFIAVSGNLTFKDGSQLVVNSLRLTNNATLNWHSTGTFQPTATNMPQTTANFAMPVTSVNAGSVVNMSAGLWLLTKQTGSISFQMEQGTFNMTGGKIICEDMFRLGTGSSAATFNLGGTGEVYAQSIGALTNGVGIFGSSILNFQGTDSALYVTTNLNVGIQSYLTSKIASTNIYIDGVAATSISQLSFTGVNVDGLDYTKVSVVPEPATIGMILLGAVLALVARKRTA